MNLHHWIYLEIGLPRETGPSSVSLAHQALLCPDRSGAAAPLPKCWGQRLGDFEFAADVYWTNCDLCFVSLLRWWKMETVNIIGTGPCHTDSPPMGPPQLSHTSYVCKFRSLTVFGNFHYFSMTLYKFSIYGYLANASASVATITITPYCVPGFLQMSGVGLDWLYAFPIFRIPVSDRWFRVFWSY